MAKSATKTGRKPAAVRGGRIGRPGQAHGNIPMHFQCPAYVAQQIRIRVATENTTNRAFILQALAKHGIKVDEEDLHDRRKGPGR